MKEICNFLQIERLHTTAYRPQTNGSLERTHRTLKDLISHYITPDQRDWDQWQPYAVSAYCSMTHSALGDSPFYLLYGRDIELPFDTIFKPLRTRFDTDLSYAAEFAQRMKIAHQKAREHQSRVTDRVHRVFNKKAKEPTFKLGDRVYLHSPAIKPGLSRKLCKPWSGPYRILELHGVNAVIQEQHGRKISKVHVNRLKHCLSFPDNEIRLGDKPIHSDDDDEISLASDNDVSGLHPIPPPTTSHQFKNIQAPNNSITNATSITDTDRSRNSGLPDNTITGSSTEESYNSIRSEVELPPVPPRYNTRSRGPVSEQPWVYNSRI